MRFISIDDISYLEYDVLGGLNLFVYCNNNPIIYVDYDMTFFITLSSLIMGAILGAVIGIGVGFAMRKTIELPFKILCYILECLTND